MVYNFIEIKETNILISKCIVHIHKQCNTLCILSIIKIRYAIFYHGITRLAQDDLTSYRKDIDMCTFIPRRMHIILSFLQFRFVKNDIVLTCVLIIIYLYTTMTIPCIIRYHQLFRNTDL